VKTLQNAADAGQKGHPLGEKMQQTPAFPAQTEENKKGG
jgi:hypothetical protein